ncbi:ABC transporter ATP-binding protein [Helicobacter kayseriensis]|uniref:ABC transporter ATP-binding protein n=1 Tax=Helicobacter kayseriensis TaxID=2905877 RepID=UPI001E64EF18|nr:ATP-binding cassette domain-containing protein [Helicobacter kayseriensis]MCE3046585.1 ATP-binding cassette domain-containing protein [Helicobacter kayseriensis]MCE3048113.1 ATP-binding cassette domain-containing protein [Helicobacter kayseriensis]
MQLLKATGLAHSFDYPLYEEVSLECGMGESIAILGVSGSGKSTILNHLSTLLPPQKGQVDLVGKQDIYSLESDELLALRRLKVGIIFQAHYLFRGFSAKENLLIASFLANQPIDEGLLEQLGIAHTLKQSVGELSGGQQQRLSIARILCKKPQMIFADEPTGNLDRETANQVMKIILDFLQEYRAGLVLATHDEKIASLCTKIFLLENQRLRLI